MNRLILCALVILTAGQAFADTYVRGYTRKDGTYVQPHMRSDRNGTTLDNWSTRGNVNPYTGQQGTRDPYPSYNYQPTYGNSYGSRPYGRY